MEIKIPGLHRRLALIGGILLLGIAIAVQVAWFSATHMASKVWLAFPAFLVVIVALSSGRFRRSRWAAAALLLTLGGCAGQMLASRIDGKALDARIANFSCAEGRGIVAKGEGLGRKWERLREDRYIARPGPLQFEEIILFHYHRPGETESFILSNGGWDEDPLGYVDCKG